MNKMAEENRLIKQAVLSTYEKTEGNYLRTILKMIIVTREAKVVRNQYSLGQKLRPVLIIHQKQQLPQVMPHIQYSNQVQIWQ